MRRAIEQDLPFARTLTQQAMSHYYRQNGLLWSNDGFDVAWAGRENWLICNDDGVMGFISLSRDGKALYIRELHLLECCRKQGAGTWVLEQMALLWTWPGHALRRPRFAHRSWAHGGRRAAPNECRGCRASG